MNLNIVNIIGLRVSKSLSFYAYTEKIENRKPNDHLPNIRHLIPLETRRIFPSRAYPIQVSHFRYKPGRLQQLCHLMTEGDQDHSKVLEQLLANGQA